MRTISANLQARLAGQVTQVCQCVAMTDQDGRTVRATSHDRDLLWRGEVHAAATGLEVLGVHLNAGLDPDTAVLRGPLSDPGVTRADIARGVWDRARVVVDVVAWTNAGPGEALSGIGTAARAAAADGVNVFTGYITSIRLAGFAFEADLASAKARLTRQIGRVYSRRCDAVLGDDRCGVDLVSAAHAAAVIVVEGIGEGPAEGVVIPALPRDPAPFGQGALKWLTGANAGAATPLKSVTEGSGVWHLNWRQAPPFRPVAGDQARLEMGCDRRFETCRTRFFNTANFRGFPHMPGSDALMVGPEADTPKDGSQR